MQADGMAERERCRNRRRRIEIKGVHTLIRCLVWLSNGAGERDRHNADHNGNRPKLLAQQPSLATKDKSSDNGFPRCRRTNEQVVKRRRISGVGGGKPERNALHRKGRTAKILERVTEGKEW